MFSPQARSNRDRGRVIGPVFPKEGTAIEIASKRRTHTSSAVKNRYNAKTYRKFQAAIKPDLSNRIEAYTAKEGISKPEFLQRAIENLDQ